MSRRVINPMFSLQIHMQNNYFHKEKYYLNVFTWNGIAVVNMLQKQLHQHIETITLRFKIQPPRPF